MTKLSLSRAWEDCMAVLARDGRLFLWVALALFVLPGSILSVSEPSAPAGQLPPAGPWIAIAIVAVLISLIGQLAVIRLALGPHISVGEAIVHGVRRLVLYVAAVLLWSVPVALAATIALGAIGNDLQHPAPAGAVALILVGIAAVIIGVRLVLTSAVASAESAGPVHILRRSWVLTSGNWWRLFAFVLLVFIGAIVLIAAVQSVIGLLAQLLFGGVGPLTVGGLLVAIVTQLLSALVSVIFFVMIAQIYRQLLGRGEAQASVPTSGT